MVAERRNEEVYNVIKGELHNETYEHTIKRPDEEKAGLTFV
jgi:hypothetical protein